VTEIAQPRQAGAWRILVADDNQDAGETLALLLRLHGHAAAWARDGLDALAQVPSFQPDLLILDIGMPRLDGHALAKALRQGPAGRALQLVALTGWGAHSDRTRSAEAGFDLHLTKPINPAVLLDWMAGRSAQRVSARRPGPGP
jgi:CheY-like chemotaxis protein